MSLGKEMVSGLVQRVRILIQIGKWRVVEIKPRSLFTQMVKGSLRYGNMKGVHMHFKHYSYSIEVYKTAHCRTPRQPLFAALVPGQLPADNSIWGDDYFRPLATGRTRQKAVKNLQSVICMISHTMVNDHVVINIREHSDVYVCPACFNRPKFMDLQDAMDHATEVHRVVYAELPEPNYPD